MNQEDINEQRAVDNMVRRDVHYCVSALVSTLAQGANAIPLSTGTKDLADLCDQAGELFAPLSDHEEAARQEGYQVRHDMHGFYYLSDDEAAHEDEGNAAVGFDGRDHFATTDQAWQEACEHLDVEPYQREVFEHWIVSDWLADKLEAKGEKIDRDFAGLTIWARTTTGQSISMDHVVIEIYRENCV